MRQSTVVRLAAVSLSLGLNALVPAGGAAQTAQPKDAAVDAAMRALSRRVQIDLTQDASKPAGPALANFKLMLNRVESSQRIRLDGTGDPAFGPPVDCKMPVIEGDPSIDPKMLRDLPDHGEHHTMRIIVAPRCAQPR